ncbi:MAG: S41 family peptidase [Clostridiales bacterium]|nr:S41 family peptidase [Bacillota bacterium]NLK03407.1 S41 family peptidase [Clostridiales bacterium]
MKRNFLTGFLSGIIGAIFLFAAVGVTYIAFNDDTGKQNKGRENVSTAQDNENNTDREESYDEIVEKLMVLEEVIDTYYLDEVDRDAFATGIYKGFISSLDDPYSMYYTKAEYANVIESSSGIYQGIGAVVSQDVKTGIITIVRPYKDGPAYNAGLLPDDIIYKVEGEEVTGEDLSEVVSKIKGKEGTKVNITIYRDGVADPMDFTLERKKINIPTIEYEMLEDDIGYILIYEFDSITISQFSNALKALEKMGMKGLIVDVRDNPGGLLDSVVKILDRLLPRGLIVYTEDKYKNRTEENAKNPDKFDQPIVVLINGNSASASEIFAGALQDYEKATIVGTTTFGKGIVQRILPLSDGTALKLTVSKYFTPKGRNIHGTGIEPDIEVELSEDLKQLVTIPRDDDNQLQKAIEVLKDKMN